MNCQTAESMVNRYIEHDLSVDELENFLEHVENGEVQRPQKCFGCLKHCIPAEIPYCITEALIHAVKGDTENGLLFCGAQGFLANQIETVQDVMEDLLGGL